MIKDLVVAYEKEYGIPMSISCASLYLRQRGVKFKRSREVLTSTDPDFQAKYEAIQNILGNLGSNDKFFSIDEYGPCSVRPKGGMQLAEPGQQPTFKRVKKGVAWFMCTCALELSTNQLTWFYSLRKDTAEMIRLIEVLVAQYQDQQRLYLSWDAASWHSSKELKKYLAKINCETYRIENKFPEVILAPLPNKAPQLNVIESVFSGFSKSVIKNSDYIRSRNRLVSIF